MTPRRPALTEQSPGMRKPQIRGLAYFPKKEQNCSKLVISNVSVPPLFLEKSVHLSVRKGEKASLVCEARGDEPMDIFWRRSGIAILDDEDAR